MTSAQLTEHQFKSLTRHPKAGFRELLALSLPLIFVLFSGSFMGFCDRLFLAHHSTRALEGCVNAVFLCALFQAPCMRITTMAQVFVGRYSGASQKQRIGECIWQMIWFSLLSMIITLPLGMVSAPFILGGTTVEEPATIYFNCLMWVNFLFPLGAALASFYIGQGRTRVLFITTLFAHLINVGLDYLLIFGVDPFIPPLGILGAAIATGVAQGVFCIVLFVLFISKQNQLVFATDRFALRWKSFWSHVRIGIPRAIARIILLSVWVATARIISVKNGDFLMVLSVGSSIFLLFSFINEGLSQAIMTVASSLIGAKDFASLKKLLRSAFLFLAMMMALLTLPFFFFPDLLLSFFFTTPPSPETMQVLYRSCTWLWIMIFCSGVNFIGFAFISAACDTTFHMVAICFMWLTVYVPVYCSTHLWNWTPDTFWLIIAFDALFFGAAFLLRARKEKWKEVSVFERTGELLS